MRLLCAILICFIATNSSFAQEETVSTKKLIKLIYEAGFLINAGEEDILNAEMTNPFYRYLGSIPKGKKINVSDIKTKFTVRYTARQWLGDYENMSKTFIPVVNLRSPDASLDAKINLKGDILTVEVSSIKKITDVFIEVLSDIPIKISEDRSRYVLSSVGVTGQNLKKGPLAEFRLYLIAEQKFYQAPVQITYCFKGRVYEKVFTFSFKREDFTDAP